MLTNENDAPVRPVTEEPTPCRVCTEPVDLRRLCAYWPDGTAAHAHCVNS